MSGEQLDTSAEAIATWAQQYLADLLDVPVASVDRNTDFDRLGIDSALAVSLLTEIEERYDVDMSPEALFENPNLDAIAGHLHAQIQTSVT